MIILGFILNINYKKKTNKTLIKCLNKVFDKLRKNDLVYPFIIKRLLKPGNDFHYCGTLSFKKKKNNLAVNENCELRNHKNFYIIDSSVFNFKKNLYPLGIVISNAIRVANIIIKQYEI